MKSLFVSSLSLYHSVRETLDHVCTLYRSSQHPKIYGSEELHYPQGVCMRGDLDSGHFSLLRSLGFPCTLAISVSLSIYHTWGVFLYLQAVLVGGLLLLLLLLLFMFSFLGFQFRCC